MRANMVDFYNYTLYSEDNIDHRRTYVHMCSAVEEILVFH